MPKALTLLLLALWLPLTLHAYPFETECPEINAPATSSDYMSKHLPPLTLHKAAGDSQRVCLHAPGDSMVVQVFSTETGVVIPGARIVFRAVSAPDSSGQVLPEAGLTFFPADTVLTDPNGYAAVSVRVDCQPGVYYLRAEAIDAAVWTDNPRDFTLFALGTELRLLTATDPDSVWTPLPGSCLSGSDSVFIQTGCPRPVRLFALPPTVTAGMSGTWEMHTTPDTLQFYLPDSSAARNDYTSPPVQVAADGRIADLALEALHPSQAWKDRRIVHRFTPDSLAACADTSRVTALQTNLVVSYLDAEIPDSTEASEGGYVQYGSGCQATATLQLDPATVSPGLQGRWTISYPESALAVYADADFDLLADSDAVLSPDSLSEVVTVDAAGQVMGFVIEPLRVSAQANDITLTADFIPVGLPMLSCEADTVRLTAVQAWIAFEEIPHIVEDSTGTLIVTNAEGDSLLDATLRVSPPGVSGYWAVEYGPNVSVYNDSMTVITSGVFVDSVITVPADSIIANVEIQIHALEGDLQIIPIFLKEVPSTRADLACNGTNCSFISEMQVDFGDATLEVVYSVPQTGYTVIGQNRDIHVNLFGASSSPHHGSVQVTIQKPDGTVHQFPTNAFPSYVYTVEKEGTYVVKANCPGDAVGYTATVNVAKLYITGIASQATYGLGNDERNHFHYGISDYYYQEYGFDDFSGEPRTTPRVKPLDPLTYFKSLELGLTDDIVVMIKEAPNTVISDYPAVYVTNSNPSGLSISPPTNPLSALQTTLTLTGLLTNYQTVEPDAVIEFHLTSATGPILREVKNKVYERRDDLKLAIRPVYPYTATPESGPEMNASYAQNVLNIEIYNQAIVEWDNVVILPDLYLAIDNPPNSNDAFICPDDEDYFCINHSLTTDVLQLTTFGINPGYPSSQWHYVFAVYYEPSDDQPSGRTFVDCGSETWFSVVFPGEHTTIKDYAHTIGHELGHTIRLCHLTEEGLEGNDETGNYFSDGNNLMDYGRNALRKIQWDKLQNVPQ